MASPRFRPPAFVSRVPPTTLKLLIATGVTTLVCVVAANFGYRQILEAFVLYPGEVLPGFKVWKLLSYVLFEGMEPIGFVIDLVVLYFFAAWFERSWGPRRFLIFYALSAGGSALLVVLLGLFIPSVAVQPYYGIWTVMEALTVAMGMLEPNMQIYFYMLFPMRARTMMYLSWGLLGLFIVFHGTLVPYLTVLGGVGMGLALSLGTRGPRRLWLNFRAAIIERQLRRRAGHLKIMPPPERKDSDPKTYLH
jgi:membrane associated rhomboid family serine protease